MIASTSSLKNALLTVFVLNAGVLCAQGRLVDKREQAEGWYLPVHGQVMVDGGKANDFELIVYKDNVEMAKFAGDKKGRFELELDIDQFYTIRIVKKGYQEKMLYIDTALPKELVKYPDYECYVNLLPSNAQGVDPFYTDFPSAIVHFDQEQGGFYHSEHYLSHIQTRLAGIASATF
ncbi:MAG: hypothetical protein IPI81_13100 [Flavobacteriales bacterium]|nr:hypothetical protein [Flavobacteriales bacterium]MCC6938498.1 hypothetical protein [Flavobacteriales bacterium]